MPSSHTALLMVTPRSCEAQHSTARHGRGTWDTADRELRQLLFFFLQPGLFKHFVPAKIGLSGKQNSTRLCSHGICWLTSYLSEEILAGPNSELKPPQIRKGQHREQNHSQRKGKFLSLLCTQNLKLLLSPT